MARYAQDSWALFFLPHFCERIRARELFPVLCRVAPRFFLHREIIRRGYYASPMSDARVVRGSAPAHEIRDCILRRTTEVNGFGRERSCRAAREFAAHNRRRKELRWKWSSTTLVESFNCSIRQFGSGLYTGRARTIALPFNYEFLIKFVLFFRRSVKNNHKLFNFYFNFSSVKSKNFANVCRTY